MCQVSKHFIVLRLNSTAVLYDMLIRQFHMRHFTSEKHYLELKYSTEICPFQTGRDREWTAFLPLRSLSAALCAGDPRGQVVGA